MTQPADHSADLKAQLERLRQLYHVSNVIHSSLDPQEALQLILEQAIRLTRATSGSAILINPTTRFLEIHAARGLPPEAAGLKLRVGEGITGHVALTGKAARIGNVRADPRYVEVSREINSELAVPLEVRGELRGVLNVDSTELNAFSESDQELLQELAVHASNVIHNTWLYEQIRLKARLLETLVSIGQTITSTLNLDETLGVITREACSLMGGKMSSLLLLDDSRQWLDLRAHFGAGEPYVQKPRLNVDDSVVGVVVRRRKPLQVDDVQNSARYQNVAVAQKEGLISLISVPLLFRGEVIGALNVYTGHPYSFSNEEIRILSALADLSAIAIEKARLYERVVDVEEHLRQNEKLSALGLLAAEVAHEIRNPLTVLKMLYHSMDLKFPAGDPRTRDAEIMGEKMEHLNRIVEKILDFARTTEPKLQPVNLNKLVDDLGLLTRHKLRNQHIHLEKHLDAHLPQIMADPMQLEQAFLNLTLNAVEAMLNGGKLRIATRANGSSVEVEFQDSGEGMTLEQSQQAFTSLLNTTKPKGAGLGLAIVSRVVEAHRGRTAIQSAKGKGTTITLSFPIG
ncbi:MAG TPA: GAF domain-containing protein [Verrucomicrobiae bacterium]|nr:GAF domain-containing protein [Verrucomicrobiae bacterium]